MSMFYNLFVNCRMLLIWTTRSLVIILLLTWQCVCVLIFTDEYKTKMVLRLRYDLGIKWTDERDIQLIRANAAWTSEFFSLSEKKLYLYYLNCLLLLNRVDLLRTVLQLYRWQSVFGAAECILVAIIISIFVILTALPNVTEEIICNCKAWIWR